MSISIRIKKDMTSLECIAKKLKQTGKSYCTDDIVSQFAVPSIENGFISFCYIANVFNRERAYCGNL